MLTVFIDKVIHRYVDSFIDKVIHRYVDSFYLDNIKQRHCNNRASTSNLNLDYSALDSFTLFFLFLSYIPLFFKKTVNTPTFRPPPPIKRFMANLSLLYLWTTLLYTGWP